MSNVTAAAHKAILAINEVAGTPGAHPSQRLIALHQLERHVQGHIRKIHEADGNRGANPISQADHE